MSTTCDKCGQVLPEYIDPFNLPDLRSALSAAYIVWENAVKGQVLNIPKLNPEFTATVVDVVVEEEWDSYGEPTGTSFVVFKVENTSGDSRTYKIDGRQNSYISGWDWESEYVMEVNSVPKTIVMWERA